MDERVVDVAIVGAGTAGLNARREVEKRGGLPLLIESGPYGTTCARVGCMPSKLLIAAADAAHGIGAAAALGVHAEARIDGPAVMARVQRERDRFVAFTVEATEAIPAEQRLLGHARFTAPTTLMVDGHTRVSARAVIIATGSTPFVPPLFAAIRDHVMVNDDVFELRALPSSLAVIGTGVIALELGQAMQRLGVRVTFFSPFDDLGPFTDPAVQAVALRELSGELELRLHTRILAAEPGEGGVLLRWEAADGTPGEERFARVLLAAGRRPNIAGLDLAASGLPLNAAGLPAVDAQTAQCGDAPIFLAGDVAGHRPLLHEAADEGRFAGANAMLWPQVQPHERRTPLAIAFTDPQMGMVGLRHDQLPEGDHAIGEVSYERQGRARVMGRNRGLVRIYGEACTGRLLGAEMFGPGMEHMSQLLAWAVQQRMTVPQALAMPFYHPVLEEGLRTALRDLAAKLQLLDRCRPEDLAEAPGQ
ncbi:dihydrolipoyl dehydrogenase [Roseococcus thiosulfatophilus]|uniref:dihydrolipoyl dehydrogenase n=1 Tax=Roseococcus thiosulfatophilus TaxID=35813 RepID=UPI001A8D8583|nr:dihydrolipoyl dehydrogenase [Roseococcus thiosulfatophilus]